MHRARKPLAPRTDGDVKIAGKDKYARKDSNLQPSVPKARRIGEENAEFPGVFLFLARAMIADVSEKIKVFSVLRTSRV
jgi:hypothetical protein